MSLPRPFHCSIACSAGGVDRRPDQATESAPISGTSASPPPAEISQKPVDPSQTASTLAAEPSDNDHAAADNATPSPTAPSAVRDDDKQTAWSAAAKLPARKPTPESPLTIDGFSRNDVPDLLRQANLNAARGDYRLARYEYRLVLKLAPNNIWARAGLRRVLAASQSR